MATPSREQIVARFIETRGLNQPDAEAMADRFLASKAAPMATPATDRDAPARSGTPAAKQKPAERPSPVLVLEDEYVPAPAKPAPVDVLRNTRPRERVTPVGQAVVDVLKQPFPNPFEGDAAARDESLRVRNQARIDAMNAPKTARDFVTVKPAEPAKPSAPPPGVAASLRSSVPLGPERPPAGPTSAEVDTARLRAAMKEKRPDIAEMIDGLTDDQARKFAPKVLGG